jgi:hypothetical protein
MRAADQLGELLGDHGRVEAAYRVALARNVKSPAHRWEPVLQELHRALALASGLAAGYSDPPEGYDQGEMQPCGGCGRHTAIRIYGAPWHYTCWTGAGCPLDPVEDEPTEQGESPGYDTAGRTAVNPAKDAAESTAERHAEGVRVDTPAATGEAGSEAFTRRAKDRQEARRFTVDEGKELADFTHEARRRDPAASDEECAAALDVWHRCVQVLDRPVAFVSWAGYTGVTLYELLAAAYGSMVQPEPLHSELAHEISGGNRTHRSWAFVNPLAAPVAGQGVTEIDVTAQYLGAASSVHCGDGDPDELPEIDPDWLPKLTTKPGYVQLAAAPDLSALPPHARYSLAALDTDWWLPMPTARYLHHDHDVPLHLTRALVWPTKRHGQRLAQWATTVGKARKALIAARQAGEPGAALAEGVLKSMYAAFLGGVLRSERTNDKGTLRPDWSDMLVSTAGCNALRALDKVPDGMTLLGGQKDSAWFLSDADELPLQPPGLTYSDQPGKWHVNRFGLVTEDLVKHHGNGRVGLMRKAITAADEARKDGEQ